MGRAPESLQRYLERPTRRRLAAVVRAYHGFVWETALRVTRNEEDAADICQEVFLKLLADPPASGSVRSAKGYLAWCVVGKATNLRRAIARRETREREGMRAASEDALPVEDRDALYSAIAALSGELRGAIELRYLAGLPNRAIAETLGVAERTVEDRLQRARELLRRKLAPSAFGLLAVLSDLEGRVRSAPAGLLERLLRVAELGSALSSGTLTTAALPRGSEAGPAAPKPWRACRRPTSSSSGTWSCGKGRPSAETSTSRERGSGGLRGP